MLINVLFLKMSVCAGGSGILMWEGLTAECLSGKFAIVCNLHQLVEKYDFSLL